VTLDFALSLTLFRVFAVAGAVSTASFVASLAACIVPPAVYLVSFTALAVSRRIPLSFRCLTVSVNSFAVSRIAVVVSCIAHVSSSIVPLRSIVTINSLTVEDDSRMSLATFFIDSAA